jgi:DNA-directed RNA polymerase subunit beta'
MINYMVKVVEDAGIQLTWKKVRLFLRELRDENSLLKRNDKNIVVAREVITATVLFYK